MGNMKALVLDRDKTLEFREVPDPSRPGAGWVLLRVRYAGICSSDLHRGFGGGAYHYPLIMGHEFSASVVEAFPGSRFAVGERVVVFPLIPCRTCVPCQAGEFAQCVAYDYIGSRRDGAFAELVWAPESCLFRIPGDVTTADAALTEPCAVALHGVGKLAIRAGDTAAVFGAGPVGNMAAQWLRVRGCGEIFVVDIDPVKLALARSMGFTPVDSTVGDPVEQIKARTGGAGAECVLEAIGLPLTFLQATQAAARGGEVVFLGNIRGELRIGEKDFSSLLRREITIKGTWNSKIAPEGRNEWTVVLSELGKKVLVAPLVSHTVPLAEGPEIFRRILSRAESFNKVVFLA
jgi:L-iditol 2-dehydrogenase/galactitol-1-phosphate 5-dehydrogenase